MNRRRLICIAIAVMLLLSSLLLDGCWDTIEVNKLAIVAGFGIDRVPGEEPVLLSAQIINPSGMKQGKQSGGGGEKPYIIETSQGKTFPDAIRNMARELSGRLYFRQAQVVVFGKDFAAAGMVEALDFMARDPAFYNTLLFLVAEQTAQEVLSTPIDTAKLQAFGLKDLLERDPFIYPVTRNDFMALMAEAGVGYAPLAQLVSREPASKEQAGSASGVQGSSDSAGPQRIRIEKFAVFKNFRLIGSFMPEEADGLLWLANKAKADQVMIPFRSRGRETTVTAAISNGRTTIRPRFAAQGVSMEIDCQGKATIDNAENAGLSVEKTEEFRQLEDGAERILTERLERTIQSAQHRLNADVIGFGQHVHASNPVAWRTMKPKWRQLFPKIEYRVRTHVEIVQTGRFHVSVDEAR